MRFDELRSTAAASRAARGGRRLVGALRARLGGTPVEPSVPAVVAPAAPEPRGPLKVHAALLPRRRRRKVVVLADDTLLKDVLRRYLAGLPNDEVTVLGAPLDDDDWPGVREWVSSNAAVDDETWFIGHGPVDIVIDLRDRKEETRRARWARLFLHLRPGGTWIVPRQVANGDLRVSEKAWLRALGGSGVGDVTPKNASIDAESLRSVAGLLSRPAIILIQKRLQHVVKLRDHEMMTVLRARDPQVEVEDIQVLPPEIFRSGAHVVSHESAVAISGLETEIAVPQMSLRHFRGQVAFAGQTLMYATNSVLADSFRFSHALDEVTGGVAHQNMHHFGARMARVHPHKRPIESLPGDYYQLDPQFSGHFGHIMTEVIARLWGWDAAKARMPGLKALLFAKPLAPDQEPPPQGRAAFQRTLLRAYGIAEEDIVVVDRPMYLNSLVSATAMWHNWRPYFVHPQIGRAWRRLGDGVIDPQAPTYDRIFVSRTEDFTRRRCLNTVEVEEFFAARGFTIVYPEKHTIGEQAAMFAHATAIAGFGGSAMFNMLYARKVRTIIILNHEGYTARNEHLFTAVLGCDVHYFWSTPDNVQPESGWTLGAYDSQWSFDFARNGRELVEVLDSL